MSQREPSPLTREKWFETIVWLTELNGHKASASLLTASELLLLANFITFQMLRDGIQNPAFCRICTRIILYGIRIFAKFEYLYPLHSPQTCTWHFLSLLIIIYQPRLFHLEISSLTKPVVVLKQALQSKKH